MLPTLSVDPIIYLPFWLGSFQCPRSGISAVPHSETYWSTAHGADEFSCKVGRGATFANGTSLQISTGTFFVHLGRGLVNNRPSGRILSASRSGSPNPIDFFINNDTQLRLLTSGGFSSATTNQLGARSVGVTFADGAVPRFFVDGVGVDGVSALTILPTDDDYTVGGLAYNSNFYLGDNVRLAAVYPARLSDAEMLWLHTSTDGLITPRLQWPGAGLHYPGGVQSGDATYVDNISSARVTINDVTAGQVSNTGLFVQSGTWRLGETGGRHIECVSSGQIVASVIGASSANTRTFDYTGTATLTKTASQIQIDATTGAKITAVQLEAP